MATSLTLMHHVVYVHELRAELSADTFDPATSRLAWIPVHLAVIVTATIAIAAGFDQVNIAGAPRLAAGVAAGLVAGKLVGVVLACAGAVRLRIAELGHDVTWRGIAVIGAAAGIGFTMALFIANLAFAGRPELRDVAFVAVLFASAIAAALTMILGHVLLRSPEPIKLDGRECF